MQGILCLGRLFFTLMIIGEFDRAFAAAAYIIGALNHEHFLIQQLVIFAVLWRYDFIDIEVLIIGEVVKTTDKYLASRRY